WKLENHFSIFFALPLLGLLTNWSFFINSSFNVNKFAQYPNLVKNLQENFILKKSFCAERFDIVLNSFYVLKTATHFFLQQSIGYKIDKIFKKSSLTRSTLCTPFVSNVKFALILINYVFYE
ncbi:hypothetical protein BpHYR1_052912, partial [Brachionus plicatilis]